MNVSNEDREFWEEERKKSQHDSSYDDEEYEDVTDEFLPGPVDYLIAQVYLDEFNPGDFYELSKKHQKIFLTELAKRFASDTKKSA